MKKILSLFAAISMAVSMWGTDWSLVTSSTELVDGARYLIVNSASDGSAKAMGYVATNNRPAVSVTIAEGTITSNVATASDNTTLPYAVTLEYADSKWNFYDAVNEKYLSTRTSTQGTSNYMWTTQEAVDQWTKATIAVAADGKATITFQGRNDRNIVRYNSGNTIFSCYSSGQADVYLYKEVTGAPDTRTAVNITNFDATTKTLTIGGTNTTTTTVTNDQNTWTAAYTYESSDEEVATVSNTGVVTAVGAGEATITVSLDIANDDANWKVGATYSANVTITVVDPNVLTVTYNFNDANAYPAGFPTSGNTTASAQTFTISGNPIIINATNAYYIINSSTENRGLFFGKTVTSSGTIQNTTSYLGFPAKKGYKLTKVVATSTSGMAGNLPLNVFTTDFVAVSTASNTVNGSKTKHSFDISNPADNTEYRLTAGGASGKNLQFDNIVLTYVPSSEDITVSTAQYATYYNESKAFIMPEGLEGLVVYSVEGNTLDIQGAYEEGDIVPAGEPLILHATSTLAESTQFTLVYGTTLESTLKSADMNVLSGTSTADEYTTGGTTYYRLSQHGGQVGFYWGAANGEAFKPGANKAYLAISAGQSAPAHFLFEDEEQTATSVDNIEAEQAVKFIENGQLIIIKNGVRYNALGQVIR